VSDPEVGRPPRPPRPTRAVTLDDVARVAGVSGKTVSNVLLGRGGVSEATRARVRDAVEQVGYQVQHAGRSLSSGRSRRVAVVVPMLYQPYFAALAERLILALAARGYSSTLRIAPDAAAEVAAVSGATTSGVDGVVVAPLWTPVEELGRRASPRRPVVQLGGVGTSASDRVVMGEREGALAAARHLVETGRRRIAASWHAGGLRHPDDERYTGYRQALLEADLPVDDGLFVTGTDTNRRLSGYASTVALLSSGVEVDAVLCVNDATAVGVLRALRTHGRRVPDDVAVTGFDDTPEARFTTPALTSVDPRQDDMVATAVQMLCERMDGLEGPPRSVRTGADLVVRASSAPR